MENLTRRPGMGGAIETIRMLRGFSQVDLTAKTGLDIHYLELWDTSFMGAECLDRLSRSLRVPVSFLSVLADKADDPVVKDLQSIVIYSLVRR